MKRIVKYILSSVCFSGVVCGLSAQDLRSSYFMETSAFKHQINPALLDKTYMGIPFLGNVNVGISGNLGMKNFVYDYNRNGYKKTTFMNPAISAAEFLGDLEDNNKINVSLNYNIASVAFRAFGGINVVEMNVRSNTSVNLPYELLEFAKTAGGRENYHIKDLGARTMNYIELAFGHSRKIDDNLTVGGKAKILLGLAYADLDVNNMDITMNGDKWIINSDAKINAAVLSSKFKHDSDPDPETTDPTRMDKKVTGLDDVSAGVSGFGLALDLGATYKIEAVEGLTASASLTDLGFISWSSNKVATSKGEYTFDGFDYDIYATGTNNGHNKLGDQFDALGNDMERIFSVYDDGEKSKTTALAATLNLGAEYVMPFYNPLTVGLLYTNRFNGVYNYSQTMLSAQVRPLKWIEVGLNTSTTTSGWCCGGILSFYTKGFNFYVGSDKFFGSVSKQFIPLNNTNMNISFGLTIPFNRS